MERKEANILVVGLGRAGLAAANFMAGRGHRVTITDAKSADQLEPWITRLDASVARELGGHREATFCGADLIVTSPGVPSIAPLEKARRAGVEIIDEAELASRQVCGELIGVTGTNGKSTTTVLIGKMLESLGRPVFVGGNLGIPLIACAETEAAASDGIVVAELSSFQLQRTPTLHPRVAVLLNLEADHLDRHADMKEYAEAKSRIFARQESADYAVVNGDDEKCLQLARRGAAVPLLFRDGIPLRTGAFLEDDTLVIRAPGAAEMRLDGDAVALAGRHNLKNALAACLVAALFGVKEAAMLQVLRTFTGLPHRMQFVDTVDGVRFFNDSKATNVSAAVGSLSGLHAPFVLIAGGRHKGTRYRPLRSVLETYGVGVVLIGEAAERMAADLDGVAPITRAADMQAAVRHAFRHAVEAKTKRTVPAVVLCPACSSYDMFRDFVHRGQTFEAAVKALQRREG